MLTHLFDKKSDDYNGDVMALMEVINCLDYQCDHLVTAIIDLHEKGYSQDFQVYGEYLLWVQEKIYIRTNDFAIVKCLRFDNPDEKNKVLLILGVKTNAEYVKGIVMFYYNYTSQIPISLATGLGKIKLNTSKQLLHY